LRVARDRDPDDLAWRRGGTGEQGRGVNLNDPHDLIVTRNHHPDWRTAGCGEPWFIRYMIPQKPGSRPFPAKPDQATVLLRPDSSR